MIKSKYLISGSGGEDKLRVGIEGQAVHLGRMGIDSVRGLATASSGNTMKKHYRLPTIYSMIHD